MTVLAGLWRFSEQSHQLDLDQAVSSMIGAQIAYSGQIPNSASSRKAGKVAFGQTDFSIALGRLLDARASHDTSPVALWAADARIDNRSDLLDRLDCARNDSIDDTSLLFLAYQRWGDALVDHVLGDFALAAWDTHDQTMTLVRDPTGQRPLHYHVGRNFVAFASMPQGLHGLDQIRREMDSDRLAEFVADIPRQGPGTFFRDISRVEPAQIVRINRLGVQARYYWSMPTGELRYRNADDYTEAFREELDRATRARLRCSGDVVAAHLSAGLDSGAVASTAARLMAGTGGRVLAVTSAPRPDFAGPVPHGRIADESAVAAGLVAQYPNMDHVVLRSTDVSPLRFLDGDSQLFAQPVGFPCNNVWWRQANEAARSRGATVMLTGEMGNLTISAGGLGVLADYIRTGRWATWLQEVIALERGGPRWRGLIAASFRPWLPESLMALLARFSAGGASGPDTLLAGGDRRRALLEAVPGRVTPRYSERAARWGMLKAFDPGNFRKGALLRWGIDERDPTADRRLIEFCFSLPPAQLLGGGMTRRLARTALRDRLPPAILEGARGYQYADWYESLDKPSLARFAERIAASPEAAAVIDMDAVNRLIADWPPGDWASARTIGTYRIGLLRALSAGVFALNAAE